MHVSLIASGGTISTHGTQDGALPVSGAADLAATVEGVGIEVRTRDVLQISSRGITPRDMWGIALAVKDEISLGAAGVVVTHGTDTLEETAYVLSLLVDTTVPVVVTGAMRVPGSPGHDGEANLAAALTVAASPQFAAYGPVVVFQDEIHSARWVSKLHSARVAAFGSPATGPIGYVAESRAVALVGPLPPDRLPRTGPPKVRVEVLWAVAGSDGMIVEAIGDRIDGLVIGGTGGGHVAPPFGAALITLAESGCPVILSSRCANPHVLSETYGGPGSEICLLGAGLYSSVDLSPLKARLRLLFGLSVGLSARELFPGGGSQ